MKKKDDRDICYDLSINNLLANTTEYGILAAAPKGKETEAKFYTSLFARDIGVSSLGALASDNDDLIDAARRSLISLTMAQSVRGQFPHYFRPETNTIEWWMPNTIDGTIWWSIAVLEYVKKTGDKAFYKKMLPNLDKAFTWLSYMDTNNDDLLEQGDASDWADEMPRMGLVLYSNSLWYWLVKLKIEVEKRNDLKQLRDNIYEGFNTMLWVHKGSDNNLNYVPDNAYTRRSPFSKCMIEWTNSRAVYLPYYLGYVSHKVFEMRCDVYGNVLAMLVGLADEAKSEQITDFIIRSDANKPYPVRALYPPIYPNEPDWKEYMAKGRQNYPWQYHNGSVWPYIGGFWVKWLAKYDKKRAQVELGQLAAANKVNNWEFNEYLHGQTGAPIGIPYQSWNMGMYIAAYQAVKGS